MIAGEAQTRSQAVPAGPDRRVIRLRPTKGFTSLGLRELWEFRELLYFLTWRDIKVRYKQTLLGASWAIIQPLFTMIVFSIFFGKLGKMASDNIPYPIFSYAGLIPWTFFATSLTGAANCLVGNANLIRKVYFPRLAMPIASVLSGVVDAVVAFSVLIVMMVYYKLYPSMVVVWLPALMLLAFVTALGVGFWLSAINVKYRDVRYTTQFLVQFWLFATPVAYPSSLLNEPWRSLYGLNPMAGVVEGFRWALLGRAAPPWGMVALSVCVAVALLISGAFYFRRMEKSFADLI